MTMVMNPKALVKVGGKGKQVERVAVEICDVLIATGFVLKL